MSTQQRWCVAHSFHASRVQDDYNCLTFPGNSCGTLAYVAPEVLCGKKVDQSIDVYRCAGCPTRWLFCLLINACVQVLIVFKGK